MSGLLFVPPDCTLGYSRELVEQIVADELEQFDLWMRGQTVAACDEHGLVVYGHDLERFLSGARPWL